MSTNPPGNPNYISREMTHTATGYSTKNTEYKVKPPSSAHATPHPPHSRGMVWSRKRSSAALSSPRESESADEWYLPPLPDGSRRFSRPARALTREQVAHHWLALPLRGCRSDLVSGKRNRRTKLR